MAIGVTREDNKVVLKEFMEDGVTELGTIMRMDDSQAWDIATAILKKTNRKFAIINLEDSHA